MCLYKTHWLPKISMKPIQVYKVFEPIVDGWLITPFQKYSCDVGETIKAKHSWLKGIFKYEIGGEGIHAFKDKGSAEEFICAHYYLNTEMLIHLCEIPPLTPYWIGDRGDIAASKMIIKEKL